MNLSQNDEWLYKMSRYYEHFEIEQRLMVTFDDFCSLKLSGRWDEFIGHDGLPSLKSFQNEKTEVFLNKTEDKEAGYSVRVKRNDILFTIHYGLGLNARGKALSHLKELQLC